MSDEIKLGDLEFSSLDFQDIDSSTAWNGLTTIPMMEIMARARNIANRILREKIAKARQVFGESSDADLWETFEPRDTYTARLVCIEEIKK